mgnify:FL=1
MKLRTSILLGCAALFTATSCTTTPAKKSWSEQVIENARAQIGLEIDTIEAAANASTPLPLTVKEEYIIAVRQTGAADSFPAVYGICTN